MLGGVRLADGMGETAALEGVTFGAGTYTPCRTRLWLLQCTQREFMEFLQVFPNGCYFTHPVPTGRGHRGVTRVGGLSPSSRSHD